MIHEKFKKTEKCSKNVIIFSSNLNRIFGQKNVEIWISLFHKSCRELNFLSKKINPESIGILSSKLWPKYETGAEYNTNSALSSIFSQNFKWGSTSNLFKPI